LKKSVTNIFNDYNSISAYWAGLLSADGCIDTNGTIRLELNEKDLTLVELFKADMLAEHDISYRESTKAYSIRFLDKSIAESLKYNYNVTVDKTHNLELPIIPNQLYPHYIRGFFDGDGCITEFFNNRPTSTFRVFLTSGSYIFLESLLSLLKSINIVSGGSIIKKAAHCWHIQLGVKDSSSFLNYIYMDNKVSTLRYLERKYKLYEKIVVNNIRQKRD